MVRSAKAPRARPSAKATKDAPPCSARSTTDAENPWVFLSALVAAVATASAIGASNGGESRRLCRRHRSVGVVVAVEAVAFVVAAVVAVVGVAVFVVAVSGVGVIAVECEAARAAFAAAPAIACPDHDPNKAGKTLTLCFINRTLPRRCATPASAAVTATLCVANCRRKASAREAMSPREMLLHAPPSPSSRPPSSPAAAEAAAAAAAAVLCFFPCSALLTLLPPIGDKQRPSGHGTRRGTRKRNVAAAETCSRRSCGPRLVAVVDAGGRKRRTKSSSRSTSVPSACTTTCDGGGGVHGGEGEEGGEGR